MESVEMKTLEEVSRLTERFADFAGNIIMQLLQKQGYVEEQGIKALLTHVRDGGGTRTTTVSGQRAEEFKGLLKRAHIPFVEIEHVDSQTKERMVFFVYRDMDEAGVRDVIKQFEISLDQECHEVDLDTFERLMDKKPYGTVYGMSKEELYAFREAARGYDFTYCVVADGPMYSVIGSDKGTLEKITCDMCYNLSGERGRSYENSLHEYFRMQENFVERMKPEAGKVKYIVSGKNPQNFITVDEQGITTHSVGTRKERGADGVMKEVVYDVRHVTFPGVDREKLESLALELYKPVILSQEEFPLVTGLSKTREAILSPDFVEGYSALLQQMEHRRADITRVPKRKPLYVREELIGYSNVPVQVLLKLKEKELPQVYVDGSDVAYPKELEEEMNVFWEQELYRDMSREERAAEREKYESREENAALEYMLLIEAAERSVLRGKAVQPELLNEVQREAMERMAKKEIKEQTMSKEVAKLLQDQMRDRRMQQEIER